MYHLDSLWQHAEEGSVADLAGSYERAMLLAILAVAIELRGLRRVLNTPLLPVAPDENPQVER